jgi:thiamine biosynthesis protein ThiS
VRGALDVTLIKVNGARREVQPGTTIAALLASLELAPLAVAVERNGALVRRAEHASVLLAEGDVLEIVTLVGGG